MSLGLGLEMGEGGRWRVGWRSSHKMTQDKPKRALWVGHRLGPRARFHEKDPTERRKNEICDGRGKKSLKFWAPHPPRPHPPRPTLSAATLRAPTVRAPPSSPPPSRHPPSGPPLFLGVGRRPLGLHPSAPTLRPTLRAPTLSNQASHLRHFSHVFIFCTYFLVGFFFGLIFSDFVVFLIYSIFHCFSHF